MTRARLEKIVRRWQRDLGLETWEITIEWDEPAKEDCVAAVWRARDYDRATLYMAKEWQTWTEREAHLNVTHELMHLVTREVEHVLDLVDGQIHRDAYEILRQSHRHYVEQAVDRLACRFVDLVLDAPRGRR
jgi:hypothetical protein